MHFSIISRPRIALKIRAFDSVRFLVVGVLRCRLSFEMLKSALVCLRGSRSIKPKIFDISSEEIQNSSAYVVTEEAKLE